MLILKFLRPILAFFAGLAFWAVKEAYSLFMLISTAGLFSEATIQSFASRIYVFLGIIMVFKVSISIVTYILNPDNFSKADVGAPAILKGFAFALIGIVMVPYAFEMAFDLQKIILKDNIIGNLIIGITADSNSNTSVSDDFLKNGGNNLSSTVLTVFYRPNTKLIESQIGSSADAATQAEECAANPLGKSCCISGQQADGGAGSGTCTLKTNNMFLSLLSDDVAKEAVAAYEASPLQTSDLLNADLLNATTTDANGSTDFVMSYVPVLDFICAGFIAYVLILFCFDVAVRSVKLAFLQLIAPVPLIAKISPKKGNETFKKWMDEVVSTYLDLFLRLIAIYFCLFVVSSLALSGSVTFTGAKSDFTNPFTQLLVTLFLIIGTFMFAKKIPDILLKLFNVDLKKSGGFAAKGLKPLGAAVGGAGLAAGTMLGSSALAGGRLATSLPQMGLNKAKQAFGVDTGKTSDDIFANNLKRAQNRMGVGANVAKQRLNGEKTEGMKKPYKEINDALTKELKGKELYQKAQSNAVAKGLLDKNNNPDVRKGSYGSIYSKDFSKKVENLDNYNARKKDALKAFEKANIDYQHGDIDAEKWEKFRDAKFQAEGDFDKVKAAFDADLKNPANANDAEIYNAFTTTLDMENAKLHLSQPVSDGGATTAQSSSSSSSSSSTSSSSGENFGDSSGI